MPLLIIRQAIWLYVYNDNIYNTTIKWDFMRPDKLHAINVSTLL